MEMPVLVRNIIKDMNQTITELTRKELLLESKMPSQKNIRRNVWEISYPGKNSASMIVYDQHITIGKLMDELLKEHQYNLLFYDRSFIQAEFIVDKNQVIKERLMFMKKHNKIWDKVEIAEHERKDEDWFAEDFGIPIMLRIDYAPKDHVECDHAKVHLTFSNHESCRIPIKGIVTFSEFVRFILFHFYNIKLDLRVCHSSDEDTITELEKKMIHINWN